mmetsp:Transcript_59222/g.138657  ORF Transcript_59222/g.138657 Transcript_59222/m.138657 type:complete len:300 (-) Transcript_59222:152-1051(-)
MAMLMLQVPRRRAQTRWEAAHTLSMTSTARTRMPGAERRNQSDQPSRPPRTSWSWSRRRCFKRSTRKELSARSQAVQPQPVGPPPPWIQVHHSMLAEHTQTSREAMARPQPPQNRRERTLSMRMIAKRRMPTVILSRLKMQMKTLKKLRVRLTAPLATLPATSSATSLVASLQLGPIPRRQAPRWAVTRSASPRTPPADTRNRKRLRLLRPRRSPNTRKISRWRQRFPTQAVAITTRPARHLIRMLVSMCVRAPSQATMTTALSRRTQVSPCIHQEGLIDVQLKSVSSCLSKALTWVAG